MSNDGGNDNVSEDVFKKWVKEYKAIDTELREASKTFSAMRKRKKELSDAIMGWMQQEKVPRVWLRENEYLERFLVTRTKPLNSTVIGDVLTEYFDGDAEQASEVTSRLYESRGEEEVEVLKATVPKKRKMRPVDE